MGLFTSVCVYNINNNNNKYNNVNVRLVNPYLIPQYLLHEMTHNFKFKKKILLMCHVLYNLLIYTSLMIAETEAKHVEESMAKSNYIYIYIYVCVCVCV
jgi:hypothetical protein